MNDINSTRLEIVGILANFAWNIGIKDGIEFLEPKVLEQHTDQIIFEIIKESYIEESEKDTKSLYKNSIDSNNLDYEIELKQNSRIMQFANYYRDKLAQEFQQEFYAVPPELENIDMNHPKNRSVGYKISPYKYEMICVMKELKLLKHITGRKITSVKKISNMELDDDYETYREYFDSIYNKIGSDIDYIMYSMLLFTTELKYNIEASYRLASKLSEYNNCKSKDKFPDDYMKYVSIFLFNIHYSNNNFKFIKENNLILMKFDAIKALEPKNICDKCQKYYHDLFFSFYAKQLVLSEEEIKETIRNASNSEKRDFIENHYNVWNILDEELVWGNKKEKHIRDIYHNLTKEIEPPKIK